VRRPLRGRQASGAKDAGGTGKRRARSIAQPAPSGSGGAGLRPARVAADQEREVNILLLGPQGSGKGTQAMRISSEYGLAHIATGEMLRAAIAAETDLGLRVKPIVEGGRLVPDDLMVELIGERLADPTADEGFILDGFPRTMEQAEALDAMLHEIGRELDVVFELQIADEECLQRLRRRAELEGRADDTPEAIQQRLDDYHRETEPLVEHYRATGNLVGIHADRPVDEVFAEIQQALEQVVVRP
jgi:adenylate kinase